MLSAEQLKIADDAIARVEQSLQKAREALASESGFLVRLTSSQSSQDARKYLVATDEKALAQLKKTRPSLKTDRDLEKFLDVASAAADVKGLLDDAKRMTKQGFVDEVVKPTVESFGSTAGGILSIGARVGGGALAYKMVGNKIHPALAFAIGFLVAGLIAERIESALNPLAGVLK